MSRHVRAKENDTMGKGRLKNKEKKKKVIKIITMITTTQQNKKEISLPLLLTRIDAKLTLYNLISPRN